MGISFGTLGSNIQLDMRLSAAASAGMVKIISSPKVATLNHKPAKISQGQQIPYQNTTATTGAVTAFVAATLSLEVTPHINANGTIVMKIDAKNDAPGSGSPPPINTKQATTEMLLRDGETTVIGGIYVDSEQESDDGVPYLMDIPLIGSGLLVSAGRMGKGRTCRHPDIHMKLLFGNVAARFPAEKQGERFRLHDCCLCFCEPYHPMRVALWRLRL